LRVNISTLYAFSVLKESI